MPLEARRQEQQQLLPRPATAPRLEPDRARDRWWQAIISAGGLLVLLPLSVLIAIAIKLTSRGPVFYRGTRIGRDLKPFTIIKFRTLVTDAEQRIGARLVTAGDPLYTTIGRFLRRYKLDEIPQLWNVVRGDMNLVGPRPCRPVFLATSMRDIPNYAMRFVVRPGMTGLAQLRGGYFTHPRDKLRFDFVYMRNRGFWLDFKLVVATFVKVLNRWLTLGFLLALVFLCASFVPEVFRAPFELRISGFRFSPFEILGLVLAGIILVRQVPAHRLYLYRTPTNRPMAAFVLFAVVAGLALGDLGPRLRDLAYFTVSGFLLFFLFVSGEITDGFATRATRVVALSAVAVALLGILEIVVQTHAVAAASGMVVTTPRIAATLGSPVVLATYLVLGMPLVLVELTCAERREERDFWLVCTTLVIVGVLLTQTRTGLLALWVTGSVFAWRVSQRMFRLFGGVTLLFILMMVLMGGMRFSPSAVREEFGRRLALTTSALSAERGPVGLLFGAEPGKGAVSMVSVPDMGPAHHHQERNDNMHLTLMQRTGVLGWALMMWVIGAALAAIYRGSRAVSDGRLGLVLWAIFSSGLGFLVSMSNFNAFYDATMQIFFWSLLGLGMAIVTHRNGRRPGFNVIWRFGPGD